MSQVKRVGTSQVRGYPASCVRPHKKCDILRINSELRE
jgi:hypothetical protein